MRTGRPPTTEADFWAKVDKTGGCWLWTGALDKDGYGLGSRSSIGQPGKLGRAHRIAYQLATGPIPEGLLVLHHCDTPPCVNPKHLYVGTPSNNNQDCKVRGRGNPVRGREHYKTKLTDKAVIYIRKFVETGVACKEVAKWYGLSPVTISNIVNRKRWAHVA